MSWFKCKVCQEKDARIADLKEQLSHQRLLLNPPPKISKYEIEQDYMLNGGVEEQHESPETIDSEAEKETLIKLQLIQLEEEKLLTGGSWEN